MKFLFALLALVAVASANPWNVVPQPIQNLPDVAAARAAHLAEHARQTAAALAGRPWAAAVGGGRVWSIAEVDAARAAHLAEVARQNGAALAALNAALARAGQAPVAAPAVGGAPQPIQDNPDVAAARAAHLAEVARQNGAALAALLRVGAPDPLWAVRAQKLLG